MPRVGTGPKAKRFAYTPKGMAAAKKAAAGTPVRRTPPKTGKP